MKEKLFIASLVSSILLSGLSPDQQVSAEEYDSQISDAQAAAELSEAEIERLHREIDQLADQEFNTQAELDELNASIGENEQKFEETEKNLEEAHKLMIQLIEEIEQLEENIEKRNEKLKEQARTVQVDGQMNNYIDFIMKSESVSDAAGRISVVSNLIQSNRQIMNEQVRDKEAVESKSEETEQKIEEQNALAEELEESSSALLVQQFEQEALLAQLAAERADSEEEQLLHGRAPGSPAARKSIGGRA